MKLSGLSPLCPTAVPSCQRQPPLRGSAGHSRRIGPNGLAKLPHPIRPEHRPMKVLIIEDDADIATNLYDYLENGGYEVDVTPDGAMGLHLAVTQHWDAILLDLSLPGLDGLAICRKLREEARRD